MHNLQAFWKLISSCGCSPLVSAPEIKRIRLTNQISVILAAVILLYIPIFVIYGPSAWGCLTFLMACVFALIPLLHSLSAGSPVVRYFFLFMSHGSIIVYSLIFGRESGIQLFFIPTIAAPFAVLDIKQKRMIGLYLGLPILLMLGLEFYAFDHMPALPFPVETLRMIYCMVLPTAALATFLYSGYFYFSNQASEQALYRTIQDLHQSQRLIEDQQLQLANASRLSAIGEISSNIAHEINNPLAIILGYTQQIGRMLQQNSIDRERASTACEKIIWTVHRISKIISGLRKLSRDGDQDPMEIVELKDIIEDATAVCGESLYHAGVQLSIKMPGEACLCLCRPVQISQVVLNLLQNAKDALQQLPEKWIWIRVEANDALYKILVQDAGQITDPEILEKMGQTFFTTKSPGKGTGLGLSIAKRIMESHGGSVYLDRGARTTTFVVELPRRLEDTRESLSPKQDC